MKAYEVMLQKCSTDWAPWHIIPANKKWYRNLVITECIVEALKKLDMQYPEPKLLTLPNSRLRIEIFNCTHKDAFPCFQSSSMAQFEGTPKQD